MHTLKIVNMVITIVFMACYFYQFVYIPIALFGRKRKKEVKLTEHNFAVLICARNEEKVIRDLLISIKSQDYNQDKITVFVAADNCTDHTASYAREEGAVVYERFNDEFVGKGYALQELMQYIHQNYPDVFDGFFVFDADNLLHKNYITEMNRKFSEGYDVLTSYRNSKNFGSSWVSAGYALWFLRESVYLNGARDVLNSSCNISGTGFLFSKAIANEIVDWPFHMLTEDLEFSAYEITKGRKIGYCGSAELFDEQPITFRQSWRQRKRWARGYMQVLIGYGKKLIKGMLRGNFSCFDMTMNIMPAYILSIASIILGIIFGIRGAIIGEDAMIAVQSIGELAFNLYSVMFFMGLLTTITEWNKIHARTWQKIIYLLTFPIFMFSYFPIAISSLFGKVEWKPIEHTLSADKLPKIKAQKML